MCKLILVTAAVILFLQSHSQNVGIGTTTPDTSAIIEMQSTNKGILIPRITEAARLQIGDPAPGMLVFQSNNTSNSFKGFYYFEGSDDTWYRIGTSKQIGIGTEKPHPKAILDIQSTDQGVLFPTLTNAQRNAIFNPPNGLHIFNADEKCLNYYDATNQVWNCYCAECKTTVINITTSQTALDFYQLVQNNPSPNYVVNISAGVTISASVTGGDAFIFNTMTFSAAITIINNGTIAGAGGYGGKGSIASFFGAATCLGNSAINGQSGGSAIVTKPGVTISVKNYGVISGGGGGGNPGSNGASGYGGGGGGGAGTVSGTGGHGAGYYSLGQFGVGCSLTLSGISGIDGTTTAGGNGGAGVSGGTAGTAGGARGTAASPGGAGGKAIKGGSGNSITNFAGGQFFGVVD